MQLQINLCQSTHCPLLTWARRLLLSVVPFHRSNHITTNLSLTLINCRRLPNSVPSQSPQKKFTLLAIWKYRRKFWYVSKISSCDFDVDSWDLSFSLYMFMKLAQELACSQKIRSMISLVKKQYWCSEMFFCLLETQDQIFNLLIFWNDYPNSEDWSHDRLEWRN